MSRTVFKSLRQLTEYLHREITEEKVKNQMSPDQRSVKNGLKKLDPIPELLRQNAVDIESPVKDPPNDLWEKGKTKIRLWTKKARAYKVEAIAEDKN